MAARTYDVAVVGAGVGGLVAGCYLAQAGKRVLLVEKNPEPGGLCHTVSHEGFRWNPALYSLRGCQQGGPFSTVLSELGLSGRVATANSAESYHVTSPEGALTVGTDLDRMAEEGNRVAPGDGKGLRRLLDRMVRFNLVRDYGALHQTTLQEVLEEHLRSPGLRNLFAAPLMLSLGLPPSRLSALFAFQKYHTVLRDGVFFPRGGAWALASALAGRFQELGGTFLPGAEVSALPVESGQVRRVVIGTGESFESRAVVFGADACHGLLELVSGGALPDRYSAEVKGASATLPATVALLGLRDRSGPAGSPGAHHRVWFDAGSFDALYDCLDAGRPVPGAGGLVGLVSQSRLEPCFAPPGSEALSVFSLSPRRGTAGAESQVGTVDALLAAAERAEPGLLDRVAVRRVWTPRDFEVRTGNQGGAIGGWEATPGQTGVGRLKQQTPIQNLFLAGHWTRPGPSALNAALSGRSAADLVLKAIR